MATDNFNRRDFLRVSTAAGVGAIVGGMAMTGCQNSSALAAATPFTHKPLEKVRVGFVGVGGHGSSHVRTLLRIPNVEICAVCDLIDDRVSRIQDMVEKAG